MVILFTSRLGYSQQDRRRIENEAFSGNLLGIVATNALELGVDIGVLDAVIMLGFPFGLANFVSIVWSNTMVFFTHSLSIYIAPTGWSSWAAGSGLLGGICGRQSTD